jgi:tRNA-splicing ligase RtcB/release factor H-coupled RctB family protein
MTKYFVDSITNVEENAVDQLLELQKEEKVLNIAVFPDIHFCDEKGIPVGLAFTTKDVIYPLITGKDMGCGVAYLKIPKSYVLKPFDKHQHYRAFDKEHYKMTDEGLGGGNHFLSLEEDQTDLYVIVHTGTRNRGIYMYQKNSQLLQEFGNSKYFSVEWLEKNYPQWFDEYHEVLLYGMKRRVEFLEGTLRFLIRNKYVKETHFDQLHHEDSIHNHIVKEHGYYVHRKGSTELNLNTVVIPLSMTRGSLFVKQRAGQYSFEYDNDGSNLNSCSHGAGRKLSRMKTMKYWHSSLKERERKEYKENFSELLDRSGDFPKGYIQEFDFAYKDSDSILRSQPFLKFITRTTPIATVKFTEI